MLQLYVRYLDTSYQNPIRSLIKTARVSFVPNEVKTVTFALEEKDFYSMNENGDTVSLCGRYALHVTDGQSIDSPAVYYENNDVTKIVEKCPFNVFLKTDDRL